MNAAEAALMSSRIFTWLDTLTKRAAITPSGRERPADAPVASFYCDEPRRGQRYVRVVYDYAGQRSVHAFYDIRTGDVYKAAGWKAPAKHVRFRLLDDASFARMIEVCDPYGGYLYIR